MCSHVGIIYSEEMSGWRDSVKIHVVKLVDNEVNFLDCTDGDYAVKRRQRKFMNQWCNIDVLIVMVSPDFLESLMNLDNISFLTFPQEVKIYLLFCGVLQDNSEIKNRFHNYDEIPKYDYEEFGELLESVIGEINSSPKQRRSPVKKLDKGFVIVPKCLMSEEQMKTLVLTFNDHLDPSDKVDLEIEGACDKQKIKAESLASNVFKFNIPQGVSLSPGQGTFSVYVNSKRLGSQPFQVHSVQLSLTINQAYINILDSLLAVVSNQMELEMFCYLDTIVARSINNNTNGLDRLFLVPDDPEHYELPTISHLAGKYNLKEFYFALKKFDKNSVSDTIRNSQGSTANQMMSSSSRNGIKNHAKSCKQIFDDSSIPEEQQELIRIIKSTVSGKISIKRAEILVQRWRSAYDNKGKSFQQRPSSPVVAISSPIFYPKSAAANRIELNLTNNNVPPANTSCKNLSAGEPWSNDLNQNKSFDPTILAQGVTREVLNTTQFGHVLSTPNEGSNHSTTQAPLGLPRGIEPGKGWRKTEAFTPTPFNQSSNFKSLIIKNLESSISKTPLNSTPHYVCMDGGKSENPTNLTRQTTHKSVASRITDVAEGHKSENGVANYINILNSDTNCIRPSTSKVNVTGSKDKSPCGDRNKFKNVCNYELERDTHSTTYINVQPAETDKLFQTSSSGKPKLPKPTKSIK